MVPVGAPLNHDDRPQAAPQLDDRAPQIVVPAEQAAVDGDQPVARPKADALGPAASWRPSDCNVCSWEALKR